MSIPKKTPLAWLVVAGVALSFAFAAASAAQAQDPPPPDAAYPTLTAGEPSGSAFTYQGQLRRNGAPVTASCNATFKLYDAATGGSQVGGTVTSATLQVQAGLFSIPLDFGWNFNGEARWLQTDIGCGETQSTLSPRTALRPAPYAFALPGMRTVPGNPDGSGAATVNVIGGVISNTISANSYNSAIGGGTSNRIDNTSYESAIGGGDLNRIDNFSGNSAIGGGSSNRIDRSSYNGVIGGGDSNRIDYGSYESAVGGGGVNRIDNGSVDSVISGGYHNVITAANFAAIPGGLFNTVSADFGFAAGRGAQAFHSGAFVWGDATDAPISSTKTNQFVVRAGNGVSLTVNAGPSKSIDVGERYRDNAIVAWGKVTSGGARAEDFGVSLVESGPAGVYTLTLTANAVNAASLIPTASAEVDGPPSGLASLRIVMINQIATNRFAVYIVNGSGTPVNNDFTFIVTGR